MEIFCLITIYKEIIRTQLFCQKIESVQYKAALAISGAIQGTSKEKLYEKFGLETLTSPRLLRRLCCMYKIINIGIPNTLPTKFLNVKLITILDMEISLFLTAELKVLKIDFLHIQLRLGIV